MTWTLLFIYVIGAVGADMVAVNSKFYKKADCEQAKQEAIADYNAQVNFTQKNLIAVCVRATKDS